MNNLPVGDGISPPPPPPPNFTSVSSGVGPKEKEAGEGIRAVELPLRDVSGQELELPKEVTAVGVKVQPTSVSLPPQISQLGVKPIGPNVPLGTGATVTLPLTDEQIAQGLHQSLTSSWRWLAEWCWRRLKQVHVGLKTIHGRLMRIRA